MLCNCLVGAVQYTHDVVVSPLRGVKVLHPARYDLQQERPLSDNLCDHSGRGFAQSELLETGPEKPLGCEGKGGGRSRRTAANGLRLEC